MRTCARNSERRSYSPQYQLSNPGITDPASNSSFRSYQRTRLTKVKSKEYINADGSSSESIFMRTLSCLTVQDDLYDNDRLDVLPDDFDNDVDNNRDEYASPNACLSDMATRQHRHSEFCCLFHQYPYPWWVYYIKPVVQVSLFILCSYGISNIFSNYRSMSKSFDLISMNLHGIRIDIETFAKNLHYTNEAQRRSDHQIEEISIILSKLTHLTNQSKNTMERDKLNFDQMLKSTENIKDVIKRELNQYDADKTAKSDYALESAGGKILSVLSTRPYIIESGSFISKGWNYLMRSMCNAAETARPILQPTVYPGQCWAFHGSSGAVVVRLLAPIYITGLTLEHISARISPTQEISSAPKTFSLWGIENRDQPDGYFFGEFTYDKNGESVQYFDVQYHSDISYQIVQLKIHSNWGNSDYTCVYRLRVHGVLKKLFFNNPNET